MPRRTNSRRQNTMRFLFFTSILGVNNARRSNLLVRLTRANIHNCKHYWPALALITLAALANWLVKHILVRGFCSMLQRFGGSNKNDFGVVKRLSNIVPALIISSSIGLVPGLTRRSHYRG